MADGRLVGDGSWELHVQVTDLQVERVLRVKSDLHIGGVMLRLVEELGEYLFFIYSSSHTDAIFFTSDILHTINNIISLIH